MSLVGSNFLIFRRGSAFYIYNKCTSYLYNVDQLHYEIAYLMQENGCGFDLQNLAVKFSGHSLSAIESHYNDVVKMFSEDATCNHTSSIFSLKDIMYSISVVPHIVIEVTEQCNLLCKYCYYGKMYHNNSERSLDMNTTICLHVLRELLSARNILFNNVVISFYGGEPLLNFNLIRAVVLFCKKEFPDFEYTFSITTNGTLLLRYIDFLKEYNFRILISLDGGEGDNVNRVYRNSKQTFRDVNYIVERLFYQYFDYFTKNVKFISVLHNESNILSVCEYFSKFNKTPMLTMLCLEEINKGQQIVYPYPGVTHEEMSQLYELNRDFYDTIRNATESDAMADLEKELSVVPRKKPLRGCELFSNKIFLAANRKIYLCEKSSRRFPFGDFKDGKMSFYVDTINAYYKRIYKSINGVCNDCVIKMLCKKCFFSEPSLMNCTTDCKLSDSQLTLKLVNTLQNG